MQVTETLNDGLKRGYAITVTAAELDAKVEEKLKEAQPTIEMKGFRKGKVPMALLRKQYGERLMGEAMQDSIDSAVRDHLDSSGDRPAGQPEMKMSNPDWKPGDDVLVDVSYEKLPDIPAVDFAKITLERMVVKADDTAVQEALDNLAASPQAMTYETKKTQAKKDDQVVLDFVGKVDGEAFEGGTAEDYPLVLGSNSFIPGVRGRVAEGQDWRRQGCRSHLPQRISGRPSGRQDSRVHLYHQGCPRAQSAGNQ